MFRPPLQQIESMRQQVDNRCQGIDRAGRISGKVENDACSPRAAERPGERRISGFLEPSVSHAFGNAIDQALADRPGGLGSHIARCDSGSARGDDQPSQPTEFNQLFLNGFDFVGNDRVLDCFKAVLLQELLYRGTGKIGFFTA